MVCIGPYLSVIVFLSSLTTLLVLHPPPLFSSLLDLMDLPMSGRLFVFGMAVVNFLCSWVSENWVFPLLSKGYGHLSELVFFSADGALRTGALQAAKMNKWRSRGKLYKLIEQEFVVSR
jgi:hypothetical protein